jgi:hypothetical protein
MDSYISADPPVRLINTAMKRLYLTRLWKVRMVLQLLQPRMLLKVLFYGYLKQEDYFAYPPGQHMPLAGMGTRTSEGGYYSGRLGVILPLRKLSPDR